MRLLRRSFFDVANFALHDPRKPNGEGGKALPVRSPKLEFVGQLAAGFAMNIYCGPSNPAGDVVEWRSAFAGGLGVQ